VLLLTPVFYFNWHWTPFIL